MDYLKPEDKDYPTEFAYKLDVLMDTHRSPNGDPYNYNEISKGTGGQVSAAYIRRLHNGEAGNPTLSVVRSLAEFFGVSPAYFLEEGTTWGDAKHIVSEDEPNMHTVDSGVRQIATRAGELKPEDLEVLEGLVAFIRERQKDQDPGEKGDAQDE